ncbi:hypothetical protein ACFWBN_20065 [Streptomyces sp. NPDC059989]|uniref:hypothetical protein n=1 Tax=Streptomyces sp. NPDC059989 TaxID=3347026 RepID=UPI0036B797EF
MTPFAAAVTVGRLVLPMPGADLPACDHARCAERLEAELTALRATLTTGPPAACLPPDGEADRVRHRWFTGHHAAFTVWQLLARGLSTLAATPEAAATLPIAWTTALYDVYSVLFLYAAGCTPEQYATLLHPRMAAAHPAFSCGWARDHTPVPAALDAARDSHRAAALDRLSDAVKDNQRVHMAVARRLVPDGSSPLRQAGRSPGPEPTEAEQALHDAHFRVERQPLCGPVHRAQLVRLLNLCLADIGAYGLGPLPDGCPERFGRESVARLIAVAVCEEPPARNAPPKIPNPTKGRTT